MYQKIKNSLPANILLLAAFLIVGLSALRAVRHMFVLQSEARDSQKKIEELQKKKAELEAYLAELKTPQALEREAKENLNLKKQGEEVVVVVASKKETEGGGKSTLFAKIETFFRELFK